LSVIIYSCCLSRTLIRICSDESKPWPRLGEVVWNEPAQQVSKVGAELFW